VKISKILTVSSVKILFYMLTKGDVRYTDLAKLIASRGVLSTNLKALEREELLRRTAVNTKPFQTY
jgi:DNA-binding HxlR family transcriptional regulator